MKTDTIFYQLFLTFPNLVFELINSPVIPGYQFSSAEIKELSRRFDGIFTPPEALFEQPIYFIEVQFQPKTDFYWRFFTEIMLYLGQYQPKNDWCAIAIFAHRNLEPTFPQQYRGFLNTQQIKIIYLNELENTANQPSLAKEIISLIVGTEQVVLDKAPSLFNQAKMEIKDQTLSQKVLELIETIIVYKLTSLSRQEIENMFSLQELKQTRYFREVGEDFKREGKREGKQEGKREGKLETAPLLRELGLSIEEIAVKLNLDINLIKKTLENQQ